MIRYKGAVDRNKIGFGYADKPVLYLAKCEHNFFNKQKRSKKTSKHFK